MYDRVRMRRSISKSPSLRLLRRWRALLALVTTGVLLGGGVAAQSGSARGLIWSVERDGRTNWLVGSVHLLPASAHPFPSTMENAFGRVTTLMEELEIADPTSADLMMAVLGKGMLPEGKTLATVLPRATYDKLSQRLAAGGLSIALLQSMQPWLVELTIEQIDLQKSGFDPQLGVDMYYRKKATDRNLSFTALETAAEQINYLASTPMDVQIMELTTLLEGGDTEVQDVQQIATAWRAGDAATLERVLLKEFKDSPAVYQSLVVDRNRRWVPRIESCFSAGNCYVVVGAAHMLGSDGLVAMLREKGYKITQQ